MMPASSVHLSYHSRKWKPFPTCFHYLNFRAYPIPRDGIIIATSVMNVRVEPLGGDPESALIIVLNRPAYHIDEG